MNSKNKNNHCKKYPEKRWVQFLILRVIYEKPSYGYKIVESIEDLTEGRHKIKLGSAYTLLRRMEKQGLLTSRWQKGEEKPDKRIYQVTKKGEELLKNWLEVIIERRKMMNKMVKFYQKHLKDKSNENR